MGGTFDLSIDGDLFKAELTLPAAGGLPTPRHRRRPSAMAMRLPS